MDSTRPAPPEPASPELAPPALAPPALDRPIFVVGHPRSGTTLLASMLGRHPDVAGTPESLYLNTVRHRLEPLFRRGPEAVVAGIETSPMRFLVLDRAALVARLAALPRLDARGVFAATLDEFRRADGKARLVEKTPLHLRHIDELLAWFPDARIVWILRDGRACVASLLRVGWASDDTDVLARQWVRNTAYGRAAMARHPGRVHVIRYEALIADPQAEAAPLLAFAGLTTSEAIFDHSRAVRTVKPTETGWKGNVARPLMADRAEAWRHEIEPATLRRLETIMGPQLAHFGYPVDAAPLTPRSAAERLRAGVLHSDAGLAAMRFAFAQKQRLQQHLQARSNRL